MTSGFLQQQVSRLRQRERIGYLPEITAQLILFDADGFEKQGLSFHVYLEFCDLPVISTHPLLADIERATLIQVAQNSSKEFNTVHQAAIYFSQAFFLPIQREFAPHLMEDVRFPGGRMKSRVRFEVQCNSLSSASIALHISEDESVRQHGKQLFRFGCILLRGSLFLLLFSLIVNERIHSLFLLLQPVIRERMIIERDQKGESAIFRSCHHLGLFDTRFYGFQVVHPVAVVLVLHMQFVCDHAAHQIVRGEVLIRRGLSSREGN